MTEGEARAQAMAEWLRGYSRGDIVTHLHEAVELGPNLRAVMPDVVLLLRCESASGRESIGLTRQALRQLAESLSQWDRALSEEETHGQTP